LCANLLSSGLSALTIIQGYLNHASKLYFSDEDSGAQSPLAEALETVTALLVSASGNFEQQNERSIRNLVEKFISKLSSADGVDGERRQMPFAAKKLEQTIQVSSQRNVSSTLGLTSGGVDLEATNARKVESKVDKKKLEKAERKIRAKQDKKVMKNVEYEASRLLDQPDSTQSYEEFFMQVNPLQLGKDAHTKSKDIKVDSIDVSISGKRILTDTSLTLAYARRYGLVGQNGIGKSTLLRALSRREVAIPTHISILHVEQEVGLLNSRVKFKELMAWCRSQGMTLLHCRLSLMLTYGGNICWLSKKYVVV
jgi:ATP-binding cassette, subfamily F, member 3